MNQLSLSCPVGKTALNRHSVRLTAAFVSLVALLFLAKPHWSIAAFLSVDFFFRAFDRSKFSVLANLSRLLLKLWPLPAKRVNARPKQNDNLASLVD